jgi:large subunit ribosomal protein L15
MQIHSLTQRLKRKPTKRIGRGGKRGTYSGSGEKGQRKRSGHRIRPAERDIVLKFPKLRGHRNKSRRGYTNVLNVRDLAAFVKLLGGGTITKEALLEKRIVRSITDLVKVLGDGEITVAVTVKGIPVSKQARAKIVKAGGKVE